MSVAGNETPREPSTNGLAVASFVLGIVGLGIGHIAAVVLGYRARRQIAASQGVQGGSGLALAGVVLGWIGVTAMMLVLILVGLAAVEGRNTRTASQGAPATSEESTVDDSVYLECTPEYEGACIPPPRKPMETGTAPR